MTTNQLLLTVLVQEYRRWHREALKIVGKIEEATEVLQICSCKLARARMEPIPPSRMRPYLARIIQNAAFDYQKAQWRAAQRHEPLLAVQAEIWADTKLTPLEALLETERARDREALVACALRCLADLPPEQARVVRRMYLSAEPPTLAALAQAEGIPMSTAYSRLKLGLSKLRRSIEHAFPAAPAARSAA